MQNVPGFTCIDISIEMLINDYSKIAAWYETYFCEQLEPFYALLVGNLQLCAGFMQAHHFSQVVACSHRDDSLILKAIRYKFLAGKSAAMLFLFNDAG